MFTVASQIAVHCLSLNFFCICLPHNSLFLLLLQKNHGGMRIHKNQKFHKITWTRRRGFRLMSVMDSNSCRSNCKYNDYNLQLKILTFKLSVLRLGACGLATSIRH
jgi:hypothetical protein